MNAYNIVLKYEDRSGGSSGKTIKIEATNIAGAVGRAVREFVKGLDRKQRFDANKGLHIEAARVTDESADAPKAPAKVNEATA